MSDDLFPIPTTPIPPLEAARRRLWLAEAALFAIDIDGTDDLGIATEQAEKEVREAAAEVLRLERETLSRENQAASETGTRQHGSGCELP